MADTAAALLIQLSADVSALRKGMQDAVGIHSSSVNAMLRQQKQFEDSITGSFKKIGEAASAYLSFEAIKGWTDAITENIMGIQRQSQALGFSTTAYQGLSILAKKADIDQQQLNSGLDKFASNLGEAQIKVTPFSKLMAQLGVNIKGVSPQEAFFNFLDALQNLPNLDTKLGVLRNVLGGGASGAGASAALAGFLSQGSDSIKAQIQQLQDVGEIAAPETVEKIANLDKAFIDLKATLSTAGASAIGGFADEFSKFQKDITGKDFQTSLATFGKAIADLVTDLPKIAQYLPAIAGAFFGSRALGLPGAVLGAVGGYGLAGAYVAQGAANFSTAADGKAYIAHLRQMRQQATLSTSQFHATPTIPGFNDDNDPQSTYVSPAVVAGIDAEIAAAKRRLAGLPVTVDTVTPSQRPGNGAGVNLDSGSTAYDAAVRSLKDQMAAMQSSTGEFADYTEATEAAAAHTKLLTAAQEDAAKAGTTVSAKQKAAIDTLSTAYGQLAASRAWDKDLQTEQDRIKGLQAEAAAANMTTAAMAEVQEREKLLADFRKTFGPNANVNAVNPKDKNGQTYMQTINADSKQAGDVAGQAAFNQAIKSANEQVWDLGTQTQEVGLYNGALAETTMRLNLYHQAALAGHTPSEAEIADIDAKSKAYGQLTDQLVDLREAQQDAEQLTTGLRDGLDSIAEAGVISFKSMGDAAGSFLQQIAQLIVKLYVMQPLLDGLFGKTGTSGGGLFGSFFGGILGGGTSLAANTTAAIAANPLLFATGGYTGAGGKYQPAGIVHKGEFVFDQATVARIGLPALLAMQRGYASGGYVGAPSIPSAVRASAGGVNQTVLQQFDLRGAIVDKDLYDKMNTISSAHAAAAAKATLRPEVLGPAVRKARIGRHIF